MRGKRRHRTPSNYRLGTRFSKKRYFFNGKCNSNVSGLRNRRGRQWRVLPGLHRQNLILRGDAGPIVLLQVCELQTRMNVPQNSKANDKLFKKNQEKRHRGARRPLLLLAGGGRMPSRHFQVQQQILFSHILYFKK